MFIVYWFFCSFKFGWWYDDAIQSDTVKSHTHVFPCFSEIFWCFFGVIVLFIVGWSVGRSTYLTFEWHIFYTNGGQFNCPCISMSLWSNVIVQFCPLRIHFKSILTINRAWSVCWMCNAPHCQSSVLEIFICLTFYFLFTVFILKFLSYMMNETTYTVLCSFSNVSLKKFNTVFSIYNGYCNYCSFIDRFGLPCALQCSTVWVKSTPRWIEMRTTSLIIHNG